MSPIEVARAELPGRVSEMIAGQASIAVVPHTADLSWAAEVAWDLARSAAALGGSVTIVDLCLENPSLDKWAGECRDEGIVDAFMYGASLKHVSVAQPEAGLHYIGVGTFPGDPAEIWGNPRWPQTVKSLSRPDSLIVFFVPEEALPGLNILLDGIVIASPSGYNPSSSSASAEINSVVVSGTSLLAVITGLIPADPATAARRASGATGKEPLLRRFGQRVHLIYAIIAVVAIGSLAYTVFAPRAPSGPATAPAEVSAVAGLPPDTTSRADTAGVEADSVAALPPTQDSVVREPEQQPDSLFWSVQMASLGSSERVIDYMARIEAAGFKAAVTPIRLANGMLWYRVLAGMQADSASAADLQARLWTTRLLNRPDGRVVRTPLTLLLIYPDSIDVPARISALRESGIPAYILTAADGSPRVGFGAFRNLNQTRIADSILTAFGITTTSINRLGNSQ